MIRARLPGILYGADYNPEQWSQSLKGAEKFHGVILTHRGGEDIRVFREAAGPGRELRGLGELVDARKAAGAARPVTTGVIILPG